MKFKIRSIKELIKGFLFKFKSSLRETPLGWVVFGFLLFIFMMIFRFPLEMIMERFIQDAVQKTPYKLQYREFKHSFPLNFSFQKINLKGKDDLEIILRDTDIHLNPTIIFQKNALVHLTSSEFSIQSSKLFLKCSLDVKLDFTKINLGLSKIAGDVDISINKLDFRDLKAILEGNPKTAVIATLLGDKIPKELRFNSIVLNGNLNSKNLKINGKFNGRELVSKVNGNIKLREDSYLNSIVQLQALVSNTSPFWAKIKDEQMLLKGMNLLDAQGNMKLPIVGTLRSPRVNINLKAPSMTPPPANPNGVNTGEVMPSPASEQPEHKTPMIHKPPVKMYDRVR